MNRLLNREQVRQRLGIGKTLLWRLLKSGEFPAPELVLHGNAKTERWRESTIDRWINERAEAPKSEEAMR